MSRTMDWRQMARTVLARWAVAKQAGRWASIWLMALLMMEAEEMARRQKAMMVAMATALALAMAMAILVVGMLQLVEVILEGPAAALHDKSHTPA
jgi:nitric oxide reductase large subunit